MKASNHPAVEYARRFIGAAYIYGANGPQFDCSGLVCEVLKACGVLRWDQDLSAAGLFDLLRHFECARTPGALAIFGPHDGVRHIAIVSYGGWMVEAGGGDSGTKTVLDARARGAMVRERPIAARKDLLTFVMPNYPAF